MMLIVIMSLQLLCISDLKSIAFNHEFFFSLTGMCMCVSKCVSVCCGSKEAPLSRLFPHTCSQRPPGLLYIARGAAGIILVWLGGVVHLPNNLGEQFVYHGFALGRGLHERAAPLLGQGLTFAGRHLPLAFQVHLVPHQDHRNLLVPEDAHTDTNQDVRRAKTKSEALSRVCAWSLWCFL